MEAAMSNPSTPKIDFCELKHTIEDAHPLMTSEQLLEVADDLHEAIRERQDDPKSGPSECVERLG
jgi:hypothetical protein